MSCCLAIAAVIAAMSFLFRSRQSGGAQEWRLFS